jgi:hypothetical protein
MDYFGKQSGSSPAQYEPSTSSYEPSTSSSSSSSSYEPQSLSSTGRTSSLLGKPRGSGITDFMNSNSLVAKISFLLLAVFLFIILLQLSITVLAWFFDNTTTPHLIEGMIDAKQMIIIPQNPQTSGSKPISRSVNGPNGIEFSWSVWIFIDDLQYLSGQYKHIFHKGNNDISTTAGSTGLNFPNNAPGLYINPNTNALTVIMNTYQVINEEIIITDIPLNKWVNVIIRCKNTDLDIYINGTVTKSMQLIGVPKQNYGDVYVAMNGGFSGNISNLWYYDYALGTTEIQNINKEGPNTKMADTMSSKSMKNSNYLSLRWYFYGSNQLMQ